MRKFVLFFIAVFCAASSSFLILGKDAEKAHAGVDEYIYRIETLSAASDVKLDTKKVIKLASDVISATYTIDPLTSGGACELSENKVVDLFTATAYGPTGDIDGVKWSTYGQDILPWTRAVNIDSDSTGCCYELAAGVLKPTYHLYVWGNCADPDATHRVYKMKADVQ